MTNAHDPTRATCTISTALSNLFFIFFLPFLSMTTRSPSRSEQSFWRGVGVVCEFGAFRSDAEFDFSGWDSQRIPPPHCFTIPRLELPEAAPRLRGGISFSPECVVQSLILLLLMFGKGPGGGWFQNPPKHHQSFISLMKQDAFSSHQKRA